MLSNSPHFYPYFSLLLTDQRFLAVPLSAAASLSHDVPQDPQQKANKVLGAYERVNPYASYGLPATMIRARNWGKLKEAASDKRAVVSDDVPLPDGMIGQAKVNLPYDRIKEVRFGPKEVGPSLIDWLLTVKAGFFHTFIFVIDAKASDEARALLKRTPLSPKVKYSQNTGAL